MNLSPRITRLALVAAALLVPQAARAQTWLQSWTLCTPGTFHSCHSVSIQTDAVLDNTNTRTGTTIAIALHNLQGQGYAADNTTSSGLRRAMFTKPFLPLSLSQSPSVTGVPSGGATGTPDWIGEAGTFFNPDMTIGYAWVLGPTTFLGGCGSDALWHGDPGIGYGGHTCAPSSFMTFSFTIGDVVDANQFSAAYIDVVGVDAQQHCVSDPSQESAYFQFSACDVQSHETTQVTPEPVTLALLGTGLLGIGGARWRRKKKDDSIDS